MSARGASIRVPVHARARRPATRRHRRACTLTLFASLPRRRRLCRVGLWRGWHASAGRAAALSGAQLATYDTAKRWMLAHGVLVDARGAETPLLHSAASLASGFVAQTVAMPLDTLKAVLMADASGRPALDVVRSALVRGGGARALFRGYVPALARQGPVMLVQMPLVEQGRALLGLGYF